MKSIGRIENHKCHMISNDVWNKDSKVSEKNICIGSKHNQ
jgi:predicted metal-dependent hydrolase